MIDHVDPSENKKLREPGPMYDVARKILLAAIGAAAYAQDEVEDFVNRLVERGELAEKEGKQLAKEMLERRREKRGTLENEASKRVHEAMDRLNVPTKKEFEELSDKISKLTRKVEELIKAKE